MSEHSKANWGAWGLLVLMTSMGCGGKSQVERGEQEPGSAGASGGGALNGGTGSVAGTSAAAGADPTTEPGTDCPVEQPTSAGACNHDGLGYCIYPIDECSSVSFECVAHVWVLVQPTQGAAYDCNAFTPPNAPKDGDSCSCMGQLDCAYTDCADRGQIHAVCDNTSWHVTQAACEKSVCGPNGLYCDPGSVCVVHAGFPPSFECAPNPCNVTPTSCHCAAMLCAANERCEIDSGDVACASTTF